MGYHGYLSRNLPIKSSQEQLSGPYRGNPGELRELSLDSRDRADTSLHVPYLIYRIGVTLFWRIIFIMLTRLSTLFNINTLTYIGDYQS